MSVRSRTWQVAAVVAAFTAIALWNWRTDGLWFQGDAPRHAANGLFWWDLLTAMPPDPARYAVSYYARYPVIAPVTYPPLYYLLEGLGFALFGPSPYVARVIVQLFAIVAGLYTALWGRRWIAPEAGWAGAFLAFLPGLVLWSNAVMLNVPAMALCLATLYHFRRAEEDGGAPQRALAAGFLAAAVLTYYPAAPVVGVCAAWTLYRWRESTSIDNARWIGAALFAAGLPLIASIALAPVHTTRHLPSGEFLLNPGTWTFYWTRLPAVLGLAFWGGLAGCVAGQSSVRWRREAAYLALWIATVIVCLTLVPARDPRYALITAPAFVLASAIGLAMIVEALPLWRVAWSAAALAGGLAVGLWTATSTRVPFVAGFREVATYLRDQAPADAVLYEGAHDGLFGFWVRALDPRFERRVVLASKLIYQQDLQASFEWRQVSQVAAANDVAPLMRERCGCRWVAIENTGQPSSVTARRMLREALDGPEFTLVRSFPIEGAGPRHVELYRLADPIGDVQTMDLAFPSLSPRLYEGVAPVSR